MLRWTRGRPDPHEIDRAELHRAARILALRSRREATGLFSGSYASAFRGGGMVFEESRPYSPGDDIRRIDWNAMARTREPFVKHYHEERDRTVLLLLDTSASMAFASTDRTLAWTGARAAALIGAAAGRAGDRVGLSTFGGDEGLAVAPARGNAHAFRIVDTAARAAARPSGNDGLPRDPLRAIANAGRDAVVFVISDFRFANPDGLTRIGALARNHDVVSVVLVDPRDRALPAAGRLRLDDPERPGRSVAIDSHDPRVRERYAALAAARTRSLERDLRRRGSEVVFMPSDRDPLSTLARFFRERTARVGIGPA